MLWQLVAAALVVGILVLVEETLHLGDDADTVFSLLTAAFATGTALGALVARSVEKRIGRTRLMAIGYLAPLMLVPAGLTPPLPVLFACLFVLGLTDAWAVIPCRRIWQRRFRTRCGAGSTRPGLERLPSPGRQDSGSSGGSFRASVPR
jgi:MFS family permease